MKYYIYMNEPLTNILSIVSFDDTIGSLLQKLVNWMPKWTFSSNTIPVDNGIEGFTKPLGEKS